MLIDPRPSLSRVGGKAYQLYQLKRVCKVPPFFTLVFGNPEEISDKKNQQRIIAQCQNQNFELMAVRSSATCEDSPKASFAGMFKTVLGVRPLELIDAISEVLNSVFSRRVADYCQAQGLTQREIRMAVIVQKMIDCRVSGVCFTRTQSDKNSILLEACFGLGEALVSGEITPDTYIINRSNLSVIKESIGYQKAMLKISSDNKNKTRFEDIPFYKRNARKLTRSEVDDIARASLSIEERLAFDAADIEWAYEKDALFILQARWYTGWFD